VSSLSLIIPMQAEDLVDLDAWLTEHGYDDQRIRDEVLRELILVAVYS
jgi:hypothetical protein